MTDTAATSPAANLFRKKPVVIEAAQFTGDELRGVCRCKLFGAEDAEYDRTDRGPHVHTIHGGQPVFVEPGDWVIPEPDGEHFYPCKPDIFAATYEPAALPASDAGKWIVARETVVEWPGERPRLGYTVLSDAKPFDSADAATLYIARNALPLGWVRMLATQSPWDSLFPAAPSLSPPARKWSDDEIYALARKHFGGAETFGLIWELDAKYAKACDMPQDARWSASSVKAESLLAFVRALEGSPT